MVSATIDRTKAGALAGVHGLRTAGVPLAGAERVVVTIHGRGATAENILTLGDAIALPGVAYLAPQAAGGAWYPRPFTEPLAANEPHLSAALDRIGAILADLRKAGFESRQLALMGFSQGACLALEFATRNIGGVGAVIAFSGGLIGPDVAGRRDEGSFAGMPAFLGCSDVDPYIPASRVRESAAHLRKLGAAVTEKLYPGMGHTIADDEIAETRRILGRGD